MRCSWFRLWRDALVVGCWRHPPIIHVNVLLDFHARALTVGMSSDCGCALSTERLPAGLTVRETWAYLNALAAVVILNAATVHAPSPGWPSRDDGDTGDARFRAELARAAEVFEAGLATIHETI